MSSIFKALKTIGKVRVTDPVTDTVVSVTSRVTTKSEMITNVVLNNGLKIPRIGLGTYGIKDKDLCYKLFNEAISVGYRMLDTGSLYGNEEYIGDVIYDRLSTQSIKRDEIFVGTKIAPFQHGFDNATATVLNSMKNLKLSYLDLVLIHWPAVAKVPPTDPKNKLLRAETWRALEKLVDEDKIKSIGVSNYTIDHLQDLLTYCKIKPTVNQVEFHPMCYQTNLLDFCKSNSIQLQAYSSLGSSQSKPPGWTVLFGNPVVQSISQKHQRTIPQILLRWGLQHDCILIPKTSKIENLKPNLDITTFSLDDDDMSKLDGLNQDKHFCWNPSNII